MLSHWDRRFLALADHIATFSKDISTKVGSVIVDGNRRVLSTAYNGFPRGVSDAPERLADRTTRLMLTVHSEVNAVLFATAPLDRNCTIYVNCPPCAKCAGVIVQSGIGRVVTRVPDPGLYERWQDEFEAAAAMFAEANVVYVEV